MGEPGAREWWLRLEPLHAVVYFDEGCRASMADLGLRGFWMGYFAGRAAPLGPVGPDVVPACFCNFAPGMVARSLPDARATAAAPGAGRPLFAATRATGWPDDPVEALWHGCSCLREHRGDGHVAALTASGLDGIEALVLFATSEGLPESHFLAARGWSEGEWADAVERLRSRGLLGEDGMTADGAGLRRSVESMTDRQAALPFHTLSQAEQQQLHDQLSAVGAAVHAAGILVYPNPMGLPEPPGA